MRNGDDDLEDDFDFDQEDDENMTNITQQRSNGDRESRESAS